MEISVLSEQVDAQSNKIHELEHVLQENMTSFRQMEEALQKVRNIVFIQIYFSYASKCFIDFRKSYHGVH